MAIRGRISQEVKQKMIEMAAGEASLEEIAEETGAIVKQVTGVLEKFAGDESDEEVDASYTENKTEFWKGKYLDAHALLVEHGIV